MIREIGCRPAIHLPLSFRLGKNRFRSQTLGTSGHAPEGHTFSNNLLLYSQDRTGRSLLPQNMLPNGHICSNLLLEIPQDAL